MASKTKSFSNQARKSGFNVNSGFTKIGFVIPSIDANQIAYTCIQNCNSWIRENFGINFSIFFDKNYVPCVDPLFSRFHMSDTFGFEGHLIATSVSSALNIKSAVKSKRYYYIYDLEWLRKSNTANSEQIRSVLADEEIVKFTRSKDYLGEIEKAGCTEIKGIVEDFNIEKIMEIING